MRKTLEERFWEKVKVGNLNECWEWQASTKPQGYGQINVNNKPAYAHRVSWELHFGEISSKMNVCHKCDNKLCVNPNHLFLGTHSDNANDMFAKGRGNITPQKGEDHWNSKLTWDDVIEIRRLYKDTSMTMEQIANAFNINRTVIGKIIRNQSWVVENAGTEHLPPKSKKLNWEIVKEIRRLHSTGKYTQVEIANICGTRNTNVWQVVHNRTWRE